LHVCVVQTHVLEICYIAMLLQTNVINTHHLYVTADIRLMTAKCVSATIQ